MWPTACCIIRVSHGYTAGPSSVLCSSVPDMYMLWDLHDTAFRGSVMLECVSKSDLALHFQKKCMVDLEQNRIYGISVNVIFRFTQYAIIEQYNIVFTHYEAQKLKKWLRQDGFSSNNIINTAPQRNIYVFPRLENRFEKSRWCLTNVIFQPLGLRTVTFLSIKKYFSYH